MGIFEDIRLTWRGTEYVIPAKSVLRAIAVVEDHVTMKELSEYSQNPGGSKFAKLTMAYAALLKFAGAKVTEEEVYESVLRPLEEEGNSTLYSAIYGLLSLMIPPKAFTDGEISEKGEPTPAAALSSQQPTKLRSEHGESSPESSGG